ncbi:hypothetical protein ALC56_04578 [Trachymyrmex septentrionalis]|uniref:Uncharacterized protein n=1 Tax=Trachymyrmex septentrionalis TaxID=34720 RepID=A0A195FJZ1_9HYME|nr:hypothetical protein ALC56_04578 [Trachymyrmex septentrionalis]
MRNAKDQVADQAGLLASRLSDRMDWDKGKIRGGRKGELKIINAVEMVGVYTGEPRTRACSPSGYAPALNADPKENEG